jgi:Ca2+-binding RTX toxin-like protein
MAYNVTGTAGNDSLNQTGDGGPGTIVGLAGDDSMLTGTGSVQAFGNSGNDTVALQSGNTGTIFGGTENDSARAPLGTGSILFFGNEGADSLNAGDSTAPHTLVGGNDSADGADFLQAGSGSDLIFGNGGADTLGDRSGNNTVVGGFNNDSLVISTSGGGNDLIFGNEGNDTVRDELGTDTVFAGLGNDSVSLIGAGTAQVFGNEGADTIDAAARSSATIVGGNDSADGNDLITGTGGSDFILGNGGADTIAGAGGANTLVGGFGGDSITALAGADLIFANEANDSVVAGDGANTVFGGLGNDTITAGTGRDTIQGNEDNDTIRGGAAIDTISGGSGNDVFAYTNAGDDGDNAVGGGPVELITDVNFDGDRFLVPTAVTFAANMGAGTGGDLNASANNAIAAAYALAGGGTNNVAAQFTFAGRTYLAINVDATLNAFLDTGDLLLDITGATGTIGAGDFIT